MEENKFKDLLATRYIIPIVIVARTTLLIIPKGTPTSVQTQRRRMINIAQDAATLCKPKIFQKENED
jgi:hypothetical protein